MSRRTRFILAVALGPLVAGYYQLKCPPSTELPPSSFLKKSTARIIFQDIQQKHQKSQVQNREGFIPFTHQPNSFFDPINSWTSSTRKASELELLPCLNGPRVEDDNG